MAITRVKLYSNLYTKKIHCYITLQFKINRQNNNKNDCSILCWCVRNSLSPSLPLSLSKLYTIYCSVFTCISFLSYFIRTFTSVCLFLFCFCVFTVLNSLHCPFFFVFQLKSFLLNRCTYNLLLVFFPNCSFLCSFGRFLSFFLSFFLLFFFSFLFCTSLIIFFPSVMDFDYFVQRTPTHAIL